MVTQPAPQAGPLVSSEILCLVILLLISPYSRNEQGKQKVNFKPIRSLTVTCFGYQFTEEAG